MSLVIVNGLQEKNKPVTEEKGERKMGEVKIPDGYKAIAIRNNRMGRCAVSYHHSKQLFYLAIDDKVAGPFTINELKALTPAVTF